MQGLNFIRRIGLAAVCAVLLAGCQCGTSQKSETGVQPGDSAGSPGDTDTDASDSAGADSGPSSGDSSDSGAEGECIPRDEAPLLPATASEYADLCEPYVGVTPTIDCGDGVPIPILVDGVEVFEEPPECDNPDFKGSCPVGSRIGSMPGVDAEGNTLPDVVWAFFCRSQGEESLEEGIASVQFIGHNTVTGATCFFESADAIGQTGHIDYLRWGEDGYLDGEFPGPDEEGFDDAFITDSDCSECHQSDPFIHTPWVDQAKDPSDKTKTVLPQTAEVDSPYWVVGGPNWDLRTVHIEENGCVSCHRAPESSRILQYSGLDIHSFMPPDDPGSMVADYAAITACYRQGPENTAGCEWVDPPGAYCEEYTDGPDGGGPGQQNYDCPDDFDPDAPCEDGDVCLLDGTWYKCERGSWVSY